MEYSSRSLIKKISRKFLGISFQDDGFVSGNEEDFIKGLRKLLNKSFLNGFLISEEGYNAEVPYNAEKRQSEAIKEIIKDFEEENFFIKENLKKLINES